VEELVFEDLEPKLVPVRVGQRRFALMEADEPATARYRNAKAGTFKLADGEVVGLGGCFGELDRLLVCSCLCEVDGNGAVRLDTNGNAAKVPELVVRKFHPSVIQALAKKVHEMSPWLEGIKETPESLERQIAALRERLERLRNGDDPAKKARNGTTVTSLLPTN
jgi:hypothetical protein